MNNVRKAAANGDWTSLLVEYAANRAGLGDILGNKAKLSLKLGVKQPLKTH